MKKLLLFILASSNVLLLSSEHGREYTKNTCNIIFSGRLLSTDKEREECPQCSFSRVELFDNTAKRHVASIAYNPSQCFIEYLKVDENFEKQGIGSELARRAIEDMRVNHGCGDVSLSSVWDARRFWEKTGATPNSSRRGSHVFPDPSKNLS